MFRALIIAIFFVFASVSGKSPDGAKCFLTVSKLRERESVVFDCIGVQSLSVTDEASSNVTTIILQGSNLSHIKGRVFQRFSGTLRALDLHSSNVQTIEPQAFAGLWNLERLILWGNKLTWVQAEWFMNLASLRTLDLSFNSISNVEENMFQYLPNLENLYLDYNNLTNVNWNAFAFLPRLKTAKIGKNPWGWWFRAALTRELDDRKVDYRDDWEDWSWMSKVLWECVERNEGTPPNEDVLDCAASELLEMAQEIFKTAQYPVDCSSEAQRLISCSMGPGVTGKVAARKVLQGLTKDLRRLVNPRSPF